MGIYDEINFQCPKCDGLIITQSKAGDCTLNTFSSDRVPLQIARSILGETLYCDKCDISFHIAIAPPEPQVVQMGLIKI